MEVVNTLEHILQALKIRRSNVNFMLLGCNDLRESNLSEQRFSRSEKMPLESKCVHGGKNMILV